jgi:predicted nucleic acid-binding Zn ribbon protein
MASKRGFEKIGTILKRVLKKKGLREGIDKERVISLWGEVVGKEISKHTRPLYIQNGILFIGVDTPIWGNEVSLLKKEIEERINLKIGRRVVKRISFRVGV